MLAPTHIAFGVFAGAAVANTIGEPINAINTAIVIVGSLLPDIDSRSSLFGKIIPLGAVIKHRTWTHSIWMIGLAFLINFWLGVGVASHILIDMLTPARVPLFYPLKFGRNRPIKVGLRLIKTGGIGELILFCIILFGLSIGITLPLMGIFGS